MSARPELTEQLDLDRLRDRNVVIIGLGGIGSFLARLVMIFLSSLRGVRVELLLVDGDLFEERNRERMEVPELGNKADVLCDHLGGELGRAGLYVRPVPEYLDEHNASEIIHEGDVVLSCVDNHATRKIISDHCSGLDDVTLISGGNDGIEDGQLGTYGNLQVFERRGGEEINPPLTRFHPEIDDPADEVPEPSCADLAASSAPQIVFTNHLAASLMAGAFYRILRADTPTIYDEVCFDVLEGQAIPRSY